MGNNNIVNFEDADGKTPLHYAAATRRPLNKIKALIAAGGGASINVKCRHDDTTPLHFAVRSGEVEVIEYLLFQRSDVNAKVGSRTCLDLAQERNRGADVVARILRQNGARPPFLVERL